MGAPVLVVEDDRNLRETLESLLVDEGYDVASIDTVEGAREAVASAPFRCVVLDLHLPDGRSDELLGVWAQCEAGPSVVVVSAVSNARRVAREYGVIHVRKPFELDVVVAAVKVTISQRMRPSREPAFVTLDSGVDSPRKTERLNEG